MLDNLKKEQISLHLTGIIGAEAGFLIEKPVLDFGVDFYIKSYSTRQKFKIII